MNVRVHGLDWYSLFIQMAEEGDSDDDDSDEDDEDDSEDDDDDLSDGEMQASKYKQQKKFA